MSLEVDDSDVDIIHGLITEDDFIIAHKTIELIKLIFFRETICLSFVLKMFSY